MTCALHGDGKLWWFPIAMHDFHVKEMIAISTSRWVAND